MKQLVNLFGGPGAGKTTVALGIAYEMKKLGLNAEYVPEYARELVFDGRMDILKTNQLQILSEMYNRLKRLTNQADYVICDSPLLLSCVYFDFGCMPFDRDAFFRLVLDLTQQFPTTNVLLRRNDAYKTLCSAGRTQSTVGEAVTIDASVEDILCTYEIDYIERESTLETPMNIVDYVMLKTGLREAA